MYPNCYSVIEADAEAQWSALPKRFRLDGPLESYDRQPVERDFLVSTRLNHLHVVFLLHLVLQNRTHNPSTQLISISADMLHLVTEAIILKECLANSGTSLVWKVSLNSEGVGKTDVIWVAYYGMAAAGIVCLSLLNQPFLSNNSKISMATVIQDLNVLVAEIETGALVHLEDPNYALLASSTRTIKSLLSRLLSGELTRLPSDQPVTDPSLPLPEVSSEETWSWWDDHNLQDFEIDFWADLAEHPLLVGTENELQGLT